MSLGLQCSMLAMEFLIYLLHVRQICCLLRREEVRPNNASVMKMLIGTDLVTYCEREKVPFALFEDWSSILAKTKEIL